MSITYNDEKKDLPSDQLKRLFVLAGWCDDSDDDDDMSRHFNAPFIRSTLVVSAWDDEQLIGAVRVMSDTIIRAVIYDLVVHPAHRGQDIGGELVRRCRAHFPNAEWLVQTTPDLTAYYEKLGFAVYRDVVLTIPSVYQS